MTNPMQPLKQFMGDALVTESFKYENKDKTQAKIRSIFPEVEKPYQKTKSEFEALKSKLQSLEACYANFRVLKNKLESFNDWIALVQHTNEFEEESYEYYLTDISQIFQELKDEPASKEFSKQIKGMEEIFDGLMAKANELK